jgi:hypothetical protein
LNIDPESMVHTFRCIFVGGINNSVQDTAPDDDILETKFVRSDGDFRQYISFRPWIHALEQWIQNPITKYIYYDLDVEGFYL